MNWRRFEDELARRRDAGRQVACWWRDDDAGAVLPPVEAADRALQNEKDSARARGDAGGRGVGAVPPAAPGRQRAAARHRPPQPRRAGREEDRISRRPKPIEAALARVSDGFGRLRTLAGARFVPVLAPPWNRVRKDLLKKLPAIGLRGLSTYGARASAEPAPDLRQVNTHVDIVAWRRGKRFVGEDAGARASDDSIARATSPSAG